MENEQPRTNTSSLPPSTQSSQQPYILLIDRAASRFLLDSNTSTFQEIARVLREEGGLKNVEALRMEDMSEVGKEGGREGKAGRKG